MPQAIEFSPMQSPFEDSRIHLVFISQVGVRGFIPSHFFTFPREWGVTHELPFGPQPCKPFVLVASLRLRLHHFVFHLNCHPILKVEQYVIDYVKVC
jgi:hypothetical protein